jgi:glycine/D-amino acid oxidase-like deaminating enzyme
MKHDVIVVGAGITGAATAYHLKKLGVDRVLLVDRSGPAAGGTGMSAAIIRQHYSNALAAILTRESIAILGNMELETGRSPGFVRSGYRMLVPADMLAAARENVALLNGLGIATTLDDGPDAAAGLEWLVPDDIVAIVHEPDGGYADPVRSTEALVAGFEALGGEFRRNTPVRALAGTAQRITGVTTDAGTLDAGMVVNAAGPWAGPLGASVGLDMPLRVVREQDTVWEVRPNRPIPETPVSSAVDAFYLRPLGGRRFVVGRGFPKQYFDVDPDNYDSAADNAFISDVATRMERRIPSFQGALLIDSYASLYDVTPDWYPIAGPRRGTGGYADAWGGSGHGFKLGPAIGRRLAARIANGTAEDGFDRLSYDRFEQGNVFAQKYGGNRG